MKLLSALALGALAAPASATWTIVVVNHATNEVCVAGATCISSFDLKANLCVLRVGQGAAAAQSVIDTSGVNRLLIWNELQLGVAPAQILADLAGTDAQHQRRQYGIVSLADPATTFTGTLCGLARFGVTGTSGDLEYAIQGNVLTGDVVVQNAEAALLATSGDTPTRVMAAMEAARAMGGDGRCSCSQLHPTQCGAPPPSFTYSAATSFLVCARLGDTDGVCNASLGCANGHYWCDLRVISNVPGGVEPVLALEDLFQGWRGSMSAIADQVRSEVVPGARSIPADGLTSTTVDVQLRDLDGNVVEYTPSTLSIAAQGAPIATVGPVVDLGANHFRFTLTSTAVPGDATYAITVNHPARHVLLWPPVALRADPPSSLHVGFDAVSAAHGANVPIVIDAGAAHAGEPYRLFASQSGTSGVVFEGHALPLHRDRLFGLTVRRPNHGPLVATSGILDAQGRAIAAFAPAPGWLASAVGSRVDWAALAGDSIVLGPVGFDVAP